MSRPYRTFVRDVAYICPAFEAALLTRTTQRTIGLSKAKAQQGEAVIVSMYGVRSTPMADDLLTGIAWYCARG